MSFRSPGTDEPALIDVGFEAVPGETVAIVGRDDAGKSTLIKLLCRLYTPDKGRILLDGIDIADVDPDALRAHLGAVFQDHVSFQAGGADGFVRALPHGYDTALGRWFGGGGNLSGGEWQKLALAWGFLRDAAIQPLQPYPRPAWRRSCPPLSGRRPSPPPIQ